MIRETAAEVAALIPRYSWELMDEEQRDALMAQVVLPRYMKTTSDGIQMGPSWWADRVGATSAAIESRVRRLRSSEKQKETDSARALSPSRIRHARAAIEEDPEAVVQALTPKQRAAVVKAAAAPTPERVASAETGPSFIQLVVRINSALIELEAMVSGWQNPAAVPAEFSRESFNDIVAKALRIQDTFDALAGATDDEDEFLNIVRNFTVTTDVR